MKKTNKRFRVIGVDTFEGPNAEYLIGLYSDKQSAIDAATKHGGVMNPCYVYNPNGVIIFKAGSY